ncbi:MAG: antibiotic biosynthesis monooxygenase [Vicinamibacteria bacterium]
MIRRIWRGWTTAENGDAYERLLKEQVFPDIAAMKVTGYAGIQLLRRSLPSGEQEFMTVMTFRSIEDVRGFTGEDYERAHVPEAARRLLARFDATSAHYEVRAEQRY